MTSRPKLRGKCFVFNETEKQVLAKPTAALFNKWAFKYEWLVRFKEEIAVAMILVAMTSVKMNMAKILQAQADAANAAMRRILKPNGSEQTAPMEQVA